MPRNPNLSYEKVAHYLSAVGKPVTIADIVSAGIVSRNTAYRILVDRASKAKGIVDVPTEAKIHGIFPVGTSYPTHYTYSKVDTGPITDAIIQRGQETVLNTARNLSRIVEDTPLLDTLDKAVLAAFAKHRAKYSNDATLRDNFIKPAVNVETYLDLLSNESLRKTLIADPNKFRTLILSMFVASLNEETDPDD